MTTGPLAERLARARSEGTPALIVYLMVDVRRRASLRRLASACAAAGVSAIELGFPFSDPVADGPVLQEAASRALRHGTRWEDLLDALSAVSGVLPVAVMTYANPVWHRGLENAVGEIAAAGGSGLIVPDLALEESRPWRRAAQQHGVSLVQMGSPASSSSRIRQLARASSGFLYLVSRYGTTGRGAGSDLSAIRRQVRASHQARPELPVFLGFGMRRPADMRSVSVTGADGAIVGSVVEERLERSLAPGALERFLRPWTSPS